MDRFNSREELEWNEKAFKHGQRARELGFSISDFRNDSPNQHKANSFRAGWADKDMELWQESK